MWPRRNQGKSGLVKRNLIVIPNKLKLDDFAPKSFRSFVECEANKVFMVACFNAYNNYHQIEPFPFRCVEDAADDCDGQLTLEIGHSTGPTVETARTTCYELENTTDILWHVCLGSSGIPHCVPQSGGICAGDATVSLTKVSVFSFHFAKFWLNFRLFLVWSALATRNV